MPTTIRYCGPLADGEELPDGQIVKPGETVEVESDLAKELLERSTFERDKSSRKSQGDEG